MIKWSSFKIVFFMVLIEILTAPGCAYCETARSRVSSFAQKAKDEFPDLTVKIVDVVAHPEIGFKYNVLTTPAIAINGQLEFIGIPKEEDLKLRVMKASSKG